MTTEDVTKSQQRLLINLSRIETTMKSGSVGSFPLPFGARKQLRVHPARPSLNNDVIVHYGLHPRPPPPSTLPFSLPPFLADGLIRRDAVTKGHT